MILRLLLPIALTLALVSCSAYRSSKTTDVAEEPAGLEVADAAADADAATNEEALFVEEDQIVDDKIAQDQEPVAQPQEELTQPVQAGATSGMVAIDSNAELKDYTVGENETLMLIAFKIYGDYKKWRKIAKHNMDKLTDGQTVTPGMVIKYPPPVEEFVWSPAGDPYLIIWGDTLGRISRKVYKTTKRWKDIWHNNEPLIRDPDKIYAGFTIYCVPDQQNEVAFVNE